jgi:hypothetical protein
VIGRSERFLEPRRAVFADRHEAIRKTDGLGRWSTSTPHNLAMTIPRTVKFPYGNFSGFSFPAASVFGRFQIPVHPQKFPVARLRELPIQVIDLPRPALLCDDGFLGEGDISLYFAAECKAGAGFARRQVGTPTVACVTIA